MRTFVLWLDLKLLNNEILKNARKCIIFEETTELLRVIRRFSLTEFEIMRDSGK